MPNARALRLLLDEVNSDVAAVRSAASPSAAKLASLGASWDRLVALLDVPPAPEERACPHCGAMGMRAATRCGHCWERLIPPPRAVGR